MKEVKQMRRFVGRALAVSLLAGVGILGVSSPSSAHTATLSGETTCEDGGSWSVKVRVDITNTPSDDTAEVKAISTTAGKMVPLGSTGYVSGNQIILNAWYEHAINWPGVKSRKGNWTDYYIITKLPNSVDSVTTMVQADWKRWGRSADYTKTFYKPQGCVVPDVCKDLPGNQPPGFNCEPATQWEQRRFATPPDCVNRTVSLILEVRSRTEVWDTNTGTYVYIDNWTDWKTSVVDTWPATDVQCPPPPVEPPVVTPPVPPKPKVARIKVRVVKNCDPALTAVYVKWKKNIAAVYKVRVAKFRWHITALAAYDAKFPNGKDVLVVKKSTKVKNPKKCGHKPFAS